MAEFALGLTKTAVEGTLSLVKSAVEEEAELRGEMQKDLVFITGEFEMMQSFLHVANKERAKNKVVLTWVRQLRNLAFDVEDCVELVVHLDNKSRLRAWLRRIWHKVYCWAAPLPLDDAIAKIKQLKARVHDVSQRNMRYNLISDSGSSSKGVLSSLEEPTSGSGGPSAFHILREVWEDAGKRRGMVDLRDLIARECSDLQVISLWGSTGVDLGTASIMRKAYCDPAICQQFRSRAWVNLKSRAWVKLMHPFNSEEFLRSLLTQFSASSHQANDDLQRLNNTADLMQRVNEQRYLIILEEVSTMMEWDAIMTCLLPDTKKGSRIVVSTQHLGIARLCTGEPNLVSEISRFSDGRQSLCAFFRKISWCRSHMGDLKRQAKCGGVFSVCGSGPRTSLMIRKLFRSIVQKKEKIDGRAFRKYRWVHVVHPFDLTDFSRRLFLGLSSYDLEFDHLRNNSLEGQHLIEGCTKLLHEDDSLVAINGLKSNEQWDLINKTFSLDTTKGCIIVITQEGNVAKHIVENKEDRILQINDLESDTAEISGCRSDMSELERQVRTCDGVFSVCGRGHRKSVMVRKLFRGIVQKKEEFDGLAFGTYRWVRMVHPFNLMDFSRRLFLDLSSYEHTDLEFDHFDHLDSLDKTHINPKFDPDNLNNKRLQAILKMKEQQLIEKCKKLLLEDDCLVAINGLQSKEDWGKIKKTFGLDKTEGCIIVITQEEEVARHCVEKREDRILQINDLKSDAAEGPVFSSGRDEAYEWFSNSKRLGRPTEFYNLCKLSANPGVLSIWGIAGVGKSCLVRHMFCRRKLHRTGNTRFVKYSWVDACHPFNLTDLSLRILVDFYSDDLQAKEAEAVGIMEGQDPIQVCCRLLREHACLVVVDGLRSTHEWDLIKATLLPASTKSLIVVVTNEASVAKHCVEDKLRDRMINIKALEPHMALNLLKKIACEDQSRTANNTELYKLVVAKCGGLPKVINAVGKYLSAAGSDSYELSLRSISRDFMEIMETDQRLHLRDLFGWMKSFFDVCLDSVKPCIFYLSVFPAGHNIRRRRLLRRWTAEGYSRSSSIMSAEEDAEKLLLELVDSSIIQRQGNALICHNAFIHEYIISRPMEDNLVFSLDGHCKGNLQRSGQHLTIKKCWDRDEIVFKSIDFSRLRSLTVFGQWKSFLVSKSMEILRVLDLEDTWGVTNEDLKRILKKLSRLKFLSLRGCREISHLPKSLGRLRQLQTLDVRHTSIVELPRAIIHLQKLQYLRAGTTKSWNEGGSVVVLGEKEEYQTAAPREESDDVGNSQSCCRPGALVCSLLSKFPGCRHDDDGVKVHSGIGKVKALDTLGVINVNGAGGKAILKELKDLTQLRKLRVSGINRENWPELCSAIKDHAHLESLLVRFNEDCLGDKQPLPKNLRFLKLSGCVRVLPPWMIIEHTNLELDVEMTISGQGDLHDLASQRCELRSLCVKPIQDKCTTLSFHLPEAPLKVLSQRIDCTSTLQQVTFGSSSSLKRLMINCSSGSPLDVSGLENLESLEEVWLMGSYGDDLMRDLRKKLDAHKRINKPVLKLVQPATSS